MPATINDYESLRQFASALEYYLQELDAANGKLDQNFAMLEDVWKDQKFAEFQEVYSDLRHLMNVFKVASENQIPYLRQQANTLEEYMSRGTGI